MKSTTAFTSAYKRLNKEQKLAVDTIDGPVMVVAGPGTGKTQTIALRIANILQKTDTDPDSILALTFTESAAKEMRRRLAKFVGRTAYYINISTFHSFCIGVIQDNPDLFTIDPTKEPISELQKLQLFKAILNHGSWHYVRPVNAPLHYIKSIISSISTLKREGVSPENFSNILESESVLLADPNSEIKKTIYAQKKRDLGKNLELLEIYRMYEQELISTQRFDFEDMIGHVVKLFKDDLNALRDYQERFQYFLVDEYQDTNSAQNELILLLASYWKEKANIFVVGDPDQSVYRFQGASTENMLGYIHNYPSATVITLNKNYRSAQVILDSAHNLISNNELRINDVVKGVDSHLHSESNMQSGHVYNLELASSLSEDLYIAGRINEIIKSGVLPKEIAVIYRNNIEAVDLSRALSKFGIDYTIQGGGDILKEPVIQRFLKILRVVDNLSDKKEDIDLFTILHYTFFNINPLDILKISRLATDKKLSIFDVITDKKLIDENNLDISKNIAKLMSQLLDWQELDSNTTFIEFFEHVLSKSGYLNFVLKEKDTYNNILRLNTLFSEVKKMNTLDHNLNLHSFLENIDLMYANNIAIEQSSFASREDAITLTTAHSAKGLEWDYVFIYKAYDGLWGNKKNSELFHLPSSLLPNTDLSKKEKNEDERRLFYVAVTRAKTHLYITHSNMYSKFGKSRQVLPSMFTIELGEVYSQNESLSLAKNSLSQSLQDMLTPLERKETSISTEESAFLKNIIENFSLSVTALNTYLSCSYKFKLNNLLKVPRAKKPYMAFGTAIHFALEAFYKEIKENKVKPSLTFLLKAFDEAIKKEILEKSEEVHRTAQGHKILSSYYSYFQDDFREPIFLEKYSKVMLGDIPLSGKIDRIDWLDESERTVRVVDYKTGKVKTSGEIMGSTENSNGDLHRQLVFYKLLISLDHRFKLEFGQAELDFVEAPYTKDKSGKYRFSVSTEEVEELKETINTTMSAIRELHFSRTTNYRTCNTCEFIDHCWPQGFPSNE